MRKSQEAFVKVLESLGALEEALHEEKKMVDRAYDKSYKIKEEKMRASSAIEDKSRDVRIRLDKAHHALVSSKPTTLETYDRLYSEYKDAMLAYEPFREEYEALKKSREKDSGYYWGSRQAQDITERALVYVGEVRSKLGYSSVGEEYFGDVMQRAEDYLGDPMLERLETSTPHAVTFNPETNDYTVTRDGTKHPRVHLLNFRIDEDFVFSACYVLLDVVCRRAGAFQRGQYACAENAEVLDALRSALEELGGSAPLEGQQTLTDDEIGPGGAHHQFTVHTPYWEKDPHVAHVTGYRTQRIQFQRGPRHEPDSVAGVLDDDLLAIAEHALARAPWELDVEFQCIQRARAALRACRDRRLGEGIFGTTQHSAVEVITETSCAK